MNVYDKLEAMVKKFEEMDQIDKEYGKLQDNEKVDKIKSRCLEKGIVNIAEEIESMAENLTDEDIDEIHKVLEEIEDDIVNQQNKIKKLQKKYGEKSSKLVEPMFELAHLYNSSGQYDEEISMLKEILSIRESNKSDSIVFTIDVMRDLIFALSKSNYDEDVVEMKEKMFSHYENVFSEEPKKIIMALIEALQYALETMEDLRLHEEFDRAIALKKCVIEMDVDIFENEEKAKDLTPTDEIFELSLHLSDVDCNDEALKILKKNAKLVKEIYGENSKETINLLEHMATILTKIEDLNEVLKIRKKLVELTVSVFGEGKKEVFIARLLLVELLNVLGKEKEAQRIKKKIPKEFLEEYSMESNFGGAEQQLALKSIYMLSELANFYNANDNHEKEIKNRRRIVEIYYDTFGDSKNWNERVKKLGLQFLYQFAESLNFSNLKKELKNVISDIQKIEGSL